MASPKKKLNDTLISSDGPEDYKSASDEPDSEIVDETALSSLAQAGQNDLVSASGCNHPRQAAGIVQKIQNQNHQALSFGETFVPRIKVKITVTIY
jgi:hypothetical protein